VITADLFLAHESAPFIVLFHQAGWSRGEYIEIAPRLNALGFNCMAVDLRSGSIVNFIPNETNRRATEQSKPTAYVDAEQDMIASLKLAREKYAKGGKVLAWGSSYSASLALRIAGENEGLVDGVVAFAPGEFFQNFGKPNNWIRKSAQEITCPVFLTGAKREAPAVQGIADSITSQKTVFLPETEGNHGSRALWERFEDSPAYWKAVEGFLTESFVPAAKTPPAPQPTDPPR
jgi:dienelactone hydrolase